MTPLLVLLALAAPAHAATIYGPGDPEPITLSMIDGRPSFAKDGAYVGGKGCNVLVMVHKDLSGDFIERVFKCPTQTEPRIAAEKQAGALPIALTVFAGSYVGTPPTRTATLALVGGGCACVSPSTPTPVPLPAPVWLLLAGLAIFWRMKQ